MITLTAMILIAVVLAVIAFVVFAFVCGFTFLIKYGIIIMAVLAVISIVRFLARKCFGK